MTAPATSFWYNVYERPQIPWDISKAQPELGNAIARGDVLGPRVLDVGCGTGDNTILLAKSGFKVSCFDLVDKAIQIAKGRIAQAGEMSGSIEIFQADVFELDKSPIANHQFDTILDSAIFHCIGDDDAQKRYVAAITKYARKGGKLLLLVFSDQNPDPWVGPRRISESHARSFFTEESGWRIESIKPAFYADVGVRAEGGGKAIFMVAERI
jgi:SAM-dependent methyltransferase